MMARNMVNPSEWQVSGYYPSKADDDKMDRQKIHLDHQIDCSRKITVLLTNWLWNTLIGGGIVFTVTAVAALVMLFGRYIRLF